MNTAENRYTALSQKRSAFLRRAWRCSALSIPSLIPEQADSQDLETPYQSLAARGVNNLASKLMLALLPPNAPFFKLAVDSSKLSEEERKDGEMKTEIEKGLAKIERAVIEEIASTSDRVTLFEALKHLLVGGNALLYLNPEGGMRCYHLDSFVVKRDGHGKPKKIIVKEKTDTQNLPQETQAEIAKQKDADENSDAVNFLYTHIIREAKKWRIYQEIKGVKIKGTDGTYPLDASPWIPMRLLAISGEDYGRSYVEEYYGDISSLDGLSQAIIEGTAAAAKVVFMIAPNSTTRETDLAEASNCGFVIGNRNDVSTLQVDKFADFRVARETAVGIEQRLEHAFILNSAIQRNGEGVTAEEIRKMVEDLETALGGVYSLLAVEFQLPYVACRLKQLSKKGRIPELPKGVVKPLIVTGVEALGRGNDKDKLMTFIGQLTQTLGADAIKYINVTALITRLCTAMGIDTDGLITDPKQLEQQQQEMQSQQTLEMLAPEAGKMATEYMKQDPQAIQQMLAMAGQNLEGMEI